MIKTFSFEQYEENLVVSNGEIPEWILNDKLCSTAVDAIPPIVGPPSPISGTHTIRGHIQTMDL